MERIRKGSDLPKKKWGMQDTDIFLCSEIFHISTLSAYVYMYDI